MKIKLTFCIILYSATLFAQQGIFKLIHSGTATKIIQTKDGNFITAIGSGNFFKLIKLDQNADTIWTKSYIDNISNPDVMAVTDIIETSDSSLIVSGIVSSLWGPSVIHDIFFMKTDKYGTLQTYNTLALPDVDFYYKITIQEAWNGGYVIAAGCTLTTSEAEILFIKLDSNGSVVFANIYNNPFGGKLVFDMIKAPDSTYIISGAISGFTGDNLLIGKLNQIGQPLWWNFADDPSTGAGVFKVINTYDNGYLLTCFDINSPVLVKLDSLRNVEFAYSYLLPSGPTSALPMPASTIQMPDSGYVLYCTGNDNIFLIRTDKYGDTLWTRSYGTDYSDYVSDFYFNHQGSLLMSNNYFVFTFSIQDNSSGNFYSAVSIIDTSGELCNAQPNGCIVNSRNYTSTSALFSSVSVLNYVTNVPILSLPGGITDSLLCNLTSIPDEFLDEMNISVYPNPFTDEITMQINPLISGVNHLVLYNSFGLKCFDKFNISTSSPIDLHNLSPGLYFLEYRVNNRNFTKKIVKI